jgi:acetyl-CoA synthetase
VIKASGYRIGPFEGESALIEHPAVQEAAVVGSPDDIRELIVSVRDSQTRNLTLRSTYP